MPDFKQQELVAALFDFSAGVNMDIDPLLLPDNQLANAENITVRGTFATHRPPFKKIALDFAGDPVLTAAVEGGRFQGACYYKPDNGQETLMAAISGSLYQFTPQTNDAQVTDQTGAAGVNPANKPIAWLWQAENFVIWNDGTSVPVFFDGAATRRSLVDTAVTFDGLTTADFVIPAVGSTVAIALNQNFNGVDNVTVVTVAPFGTFLVTAGSGTPNITIQNINAGPVGATAIAPITVTWTAAAAELPPGRMGTYGMGRIWMCLPDGKQFIASDIVGGSSGTLALNFRDAVLKISENTFLAGGGNFTVPGSVGDIRAMKFVATLDGSLGQGPLQVLTPNTVFSCNAPVDRLTWQDLTNPILTESLIANGGQGQNSTVLANGDMMFRSLDGFRSLILGRRQFDSPGNVPLSREVDPILRLDDPSLLQFGSAIVFDNRLLFTAAPAVSETQGIYDRSLIALNFDPISSLRGKSAPVYDGEWSGLNVLQLLVGQFSGVERAFAFTLNTITNKIELYEILPQDQQIYDSIPQNSPITWEFESAALFDEGDGKDRQLKRLQDGEIYVDSLVGQVDFQAWYKPDQWPCWIPWFKWSECAQAPDPANPSTFNFQPQYRPRMGLGEPDSTLCDSTTNRPFREGYSFQFRFVITGHCRFIGARFKAFTIPQQQFAPQICTPPCPA